MADFRLMSAELSKKGNGVHFRRYVGTCAVFAILAYVVGCGGAKKQVIDNKVPLVKVHGIVHINGAPKRDVLVVLRSIRPVAEKRKQYLNHSSESNENGEFAFTTYENYDGVPAGEYGIFAVWKVSKFIPERARSEVVDYFEGKYNDKDHPIKTFTAADSEIDLGTIELEVDKLPPSQ